jgi:nicotinamide mononucleotide (NMN) deamidase PncC
MAKSKIVAESRIVQADDGTVIGYIERTHMEPLGTVWTAHYAPPGEPNTRCGKFGGGDDDAANQRRAAAAVQAIHTRRHRLSID